jgi:hypothetical protein
MTGPRRKVASRNVRKPARSVALGKAAPKRKPVTTVEDYVERCAPKQQPLVRSLRKLVLEAAPRADETIKWGAPTYTQDGNLCYISACDGHVNIGFYRGAKLPDPKGLLQGTGKGLRHVKVFTREDIEPGPLKTLVRAAVALNHET